MDNSPLAKLPPELKNSIYEYALIKPNSIAIAEDTKWPGLLAACREVRQETMLMFYCRNSFAVTVINCDSHLYDRFLHHVQSTCTKIGPNARGVKIYAWLRGLKWSNLMDWCYKIQQGSSRSGFQPDRNMIADFKVIYAAHKIAATSLKFATPWVWCKQELEALRLVAEHVNPEWAK